jgi:hypothetical protein
VIYLRSKKRIANFEVILNTKVILFLVIGAVGLFFYSNNIQNIQPLNKFKEKYGYELGRCIGARGDIDYEYKTKASSDGGAIIVTMKSEGETLQVVYAYNKKTKIFNEWPSAVEINGVAKSLIDYGAFCMRNQIR